MFQWCCFNSCFGTKRIAKNNTYSSRKEVNSLSDNQISYESQSTAEKKRSLKEFLEIAKKIINKSRLHMFQIQQKDKRKNKLTKNSVESECSRIKNLKPYRKRKNKTKKDLLIHKSEQKSRSRKRKKSHVKFEDYSSEKNKYKNKLEVEMEEIQTDMIEPSYKLVVMKKNILGEEQIENFNDKYNKKISLFNNSYSESKNEFDFDGSKSQTQSRINQIQDFPHEKPDADFSGDQTEKSNTRSLIMRDKSYILSRRIPIIKVIGDIQEVMPINISEKIPTYKSIEQDVSKDVTHMHRKDLIENLQKEVIKFAKQGTKFLNKQVSQSEVAGKKEIRRQSNESNFTPVELNSKSLLSVFDNHDARSNFLEHNLKMVRNKSDTSLKSWISTYSNSINSEIFNIDGTVIKSNFYNPHTSLRGIMKK